MSAKISDEESEKFTDNMIVNLGVAGSSPVGRPILHSKLRKQAGSLSKRPLTVHGHFLLEWYRVMRIDSRSS